VSNPESSDAVSGDPERLRAALADANLPTLLLVLRHLTGDQRWTTAPYRPSKGKPLDDNDTAGLADDLQAEVRSAAYDAVMAFRDGLITPVDPTPEQVTEMLGCALAEPVPTEYGPLLSEELGLASRDVDIPSAVVPDDFRVVIIGAGLSGLCAAIKLARTDINFVILEKDEDLGGTWLENVYPGCGVDTPSHLYSFSFAPNPKYSRYFAKRNEVQGYLQGLADSFDIKSRIRFLTEVVRAQYESDSATWQIETRNTDGQSETLSANVLISAVGMVNRPSIPPIPGLAEFPGPVMHTAAWDTTVDLVGKRVAVIGNGASAMQLVPAIADDAARVTVFQRSKQWAVPHPNYHRTVDESVRYLMAEVPHYLRWYRLRSFWNFSDRLHSSLQIDPHWAHPERSVNETNDRHRVFLTGYIKSQLGNRTDLLDACLPEYPPYGKRPLLDNGWYSTVSRDDVDLVSDAVRNVDGNRVVSCTGATAEVDVIALATGFKTLQFLWPMEIVGRSGRTLREQWGEDDARAYLGVTVADFPNFFIVNGPNTNAGHGGSAIHATEFQVRYILQALAYLLANELACIEVDRDVFVKYNVELDDALSQSIWSHKGMTTYYRNQAGRIVLSSPWKYVDYWGLLREFDDREYHSEAHAPESAAAM
jgi:4-hydroxyacetophenone monooxygenase